VVVADRVQDILDRDLQTGRDHLRLAGLRGQSQDIVN
jgi:hypothetical protein